MKSVNQQYRESGSDKSFKDWLNDQAEMGIVQKKKAPKEVNFSMDGKLGVTLFGIPLSYLLIGSAVVIGGIYIYKKYKK
jgi:hypothetical protein